MKESKLYLRFVAPLFLRVLTAAAIIGLLVYSLFYIDDYTIAGMDFILFRTGSKILLSEQRQEMYDVFVQWENQPERLELGKRVAPFRYPSPLAILFVPFTFVSLSTAFKIFAVLNVGILAFAVIIFGNRINFKSRNILLLATFTFWPAIATVIVGQLSILLLLLLVGIYSLLVSKRYFAVGVISSLLLVKPHMVILIPFLFVFIDNKYEFLKGLVLGVFCFALLTLSINGFGFFQSYLSFVLATETPYYGEFVKGFTGITVFFQYLNQFVAWPRTTTYVLSALLYVTTLGLFIKYSSQLKLTDKFAYSVLFMVALTLHTWQYDLIFLLIPLFVILEKTLSTKQLPKRMLYVTLFLLIYFSYAILNSSIMYLTSILILISGIALLVGERHLKE